ncbi:MAG: endolytic transglycosylase MltG [Gaiellaceae bacterium]
MSTRKSSAGGGTVMARRFIALLLLIAAGAGAAWAVVSVRDAGGTATTTSSAPPLKVLRIVFPEGYTREDMAQQIADVNVIAKRKRHVTPRLSPERYLALTESSALPSQFAGDKKSRSLEGFLFPATYDFTKRTTTKQLVDDQLEAFDENWSQVDLRYAKSKNLTPYDVLIIASLIEKEVAAPEERAKVASVIYNRLKARMKLEIDATTRYALDVPATEPLKQSQLDDPNPYNTRANFGLPPGPIANPGLPSMQAAAHPLKTKFLFFVRKPDKQHHAFFTNLDDFNNYQRAHGY